MFKLNRHILAITSTLVIGLISSLSSLALARDTTYDEYSSIEFHTEVPKTIYKEARDITLEIHKRYPSDKYFHLYLGRSGTLLSRIDQNLSPKIAANLPFSGAYMPDEWNGKRKLDEPDFRPLSKSQTDKLFEHFINYLPSFEELAGRKIVLIDYISSGEGMRSALTYLAKLNESLGFPYEFTGFALTNDSEKVLRRKAYEHPDYRSELKAEISGNSGLPVEIFSMEKAPDFGFSLMGNKFDKVAEYGRFNPGLDKSEKLKRRISFDLLAYRLFEKMKDDKVFESGLPAKVWSQFKRRENELADLEVVTHDQRLLEESITNAMLLYKDYVGRPEAFEFYMKIRRSQQSAVHVEQIFQVMIPSLTVEDQKKALVWELKNANQHEVAEFFPFDLKNTELLQWAFGNLDSYRQVQLIQRVFPNMKDSNLKRKLLNEAYLKVNRQISESKTTFEIQNLQSTKRTLEASTSSLGMGLFCPKVHPSSKQKFGRY